MSRWDPASWNGSVAPGAQGLTDFFRFYFWWCMLGATAIFIHGVVQDGGEDAIHSVLFWGLMMLGIVCIPLMIDDPVKK
jgi:hypothetical protein